MKRRREKKRKIQCKLVVSHYRIYEISVQYHTIKHTHFPGGVLLLLYVLCLRNIYTCACRCTARHTFHFVSFYCYEYWVLLDMLYVCWNTLIFETASLQFSHEYFKIETEIAMLSAVRWIRWYVYAYLVPGRFHWTMVWVNYHDNPTQSNENAFEFLNIHLGSRRYAPVYLCRPFYPVFAHPLSLARSFEFSRFRYCYSHSHSLLHFSANTTSLTFQRRPYVYLYICTRTPIKVDIIRVTSFGINGHTLFENGSFKC